jgi:hypothetical protein
MAILENRLLFKNYLNVDPGPFHIFFTLLISVCPPAQFHQIRKYFVEDLKNLASSYGALHHSCSYQNQQCWMYLKYISVVTIWRRRVKKGKPNVLIKMNALSQHIEE